MAEKVERSQDEGSKDEEESSQDSSQEESVILRIIRDLRERQRVKFDIQEEDFLAAVRAIHEAYNPCNMTADSQRIPLDFNDSALRYAYLVKYPIYAAALQYFLSRNRAHIENVLMRRDTINICCLGGGPGTDVIGFAAEFCENLQGKEVKFTLIDNKSGWETVFNGLFDVADDQRHGNMGKFLKSEGVSHSFICDDLSDPMEETLETVRRADILILMKFVSAVDPKIASQILQDLYTGINPGALVIFLDNSGGGSKETARKAAGKCKLEEIGWSSDYEKYEKPGFDEEQWGVPGRNDISIAVRMWKKA